MRSKPPRSLQLTPAAQSPRRPRLGDRLAAERQRRFVGRGDELARFTSLLSPDSPIALLHVSGPGGVGKTTLLHAFARRCAERGIPYVHLDGRSIEPTPDAAWSAVGAALQAMEERATQEYAGRQVIFVDAYERLARLDGWLRDVLLPDLPAQVLVVLAGVDPLASSWRGDLAWEGLLDTMALRYLRPDESRDYLTRRGVPEDQHTAILGFTHGHPLALSLIADAAAQRAGWRFQPEEALDIVKTLLDEFAQVVPSEAHRAALDACAQVRLMTEPLLAAMMGTPNAYELFAWLRGLSIIESGQAGIFPHDLARTLLDADLRWRNPDWHADLHHRARAFYQAHLPRAGEREYQRMLFDLVYLHRHNARLRPFLAWDETGGSLPTSGTFADAAPLQHMVTRHEGEESGHILNYWFARHPEQFQVFRDGAGQPVGFVAALALHEMTEAERAHDPAAAAAWRAIEARAALRPGEGATLIRFWMADETYQQVSPLQSLVFMTVVRHCLTTSRLAYTVFPCAQPEFWAEAMAYADLERMPGADFTCGGMRYGAFGHDWRAVPPAAWMARLAERELGTATTQTAPPTPTQALVVLSQPEFKEAVRAALREYTRPDALRSSPLLRSRLVVRRAGLDADVETRVMALRALLVDTCQVLQDGRRDVKLFRALHHTYFDPEPTQEKAADRLGLPFTTYRRHLKIGIARMVDLLWADETDHLGAPMP